MRKLSRKGPTNAPGFTLIELLMAMGVLMFGLVAVAQLVPLAVSLNAANRQDSTAVVIAQRELNQMIAQSLSNTTFTDDLNNQCLLGDPTNPGQVVGSPIVVNNGSPQINFSGTQQQPGYGFNYSDPNDPSNATYDVRWAVVTIVKGGVTTARRFIIGVKRIGGNGPLLPVTLDTTVQR